MMEAMGAGVTPTTVAPLVHAMSVASKLPNQSASWCPTADDMGTGRLLLCNTRKFHHNKILLAKWFSFIF
jgi:hypothetical protein